MGRREFYPSYSIGGYGGLFTGYPLDPCTRQASRKLTCSLALRPRGGPVIERQRRNGPSREAARALAQSGAPRSMKTGTIVSPWRYDTAAAQAIRSDNVRRTAMLSYARSTTLLSMSLVPWLSIDCGLARSGMHGSGAESTLTNHANFGIICS